MRKLLTLFLLCLPLNAWSAISSRLNIEETDGSPSTFPYKLKVTAGSLTDNGDGTATLTTGGGSGGGGSSSLQVTRSGVQITSPTTSINFNSQGFILGAVGSTATIALNPATTDFIHSQGTAQTNATAYPDFLVVNTSGTIGSGNYINGNTRLPVLTALGNYSDGSLQTESPIFSIDNAPSSGGNAISLMSFAVNATDKHFFALDTSYNAGSGKGCLLEMDRNSPGTVNMQLCQGTSGTNEAIYNRMGKLANTYIGLLDLYPTGSQDTPTLIVRRNNDAAGGIPKDMARFTSNDGATAFTTIGPEGSISTTYGVTAATGAFSTGLTVSGQNVCQSNGTNCAALFATSTATGTLAASLFATSTATGTIVPALLVSTNEWSGGNTYSGPVSVKASSVTLNNTTTANALRVNQTGNIGASSSVGGAINVTNTNNTGAAFVAYSNQAAPTDNLVNLRVDNNSFTQSGVFVDFRGGHTGTLTPAVSIVSSGTASGYALNVVGKSTGTSSFQLSGNEASVATFKITHTSPTVVGNQSDVNSAAISVSLAGAGTQAQGIFVDAPSGTTGKLINLRNGGVEQLTVAGDGTLTAKYGVVSGSMTTSSETVNGQFKTTGNSYLGVVGTSTTFTGSIYFGSSPVKSTDYVMASSDTVILASGSFPSPIQITLPSATPPGHIVVFYKVDNSTTAVVLKGNGSDLIFSTNTYTFYARGEGGTLMSDGTGWIAIGQFNYHANTAGHYLNQVAALAVAASSDTITSPLILNTPISVCSVRWGISTPGGGQINVGIYDGTSGSLITSTGPVSVGAAGYNSAAIPPVMLGPGNYLLAAQINNISTTISRAAPTSAIGCYKQAGAAMTLPNPISLATLSTTNCPLIDLVTCGGWTQ